jgi:hypothetical protein
MVFEFMGRFSCQPRRINVTLDDFGTFDRPRRASVQARIALNAEGEPSIANGEDLTEELDHTED